MARYGWGKTRGPKDRELVPPPVMSHLDRWRLDQFLTWEDRRICDCIDRDRSGGPVRSRRPASAREAIPSGVDELAAPAASAAGGDRVEPEPVEAQVIERDDRNRA